MRPLLISLPAILLTLLSPFPASADDPLEAAERWQQRLFEKTAPAVVFLSNRQGFGSGFFLSGDGLVLTNNHVVKSSENVDVVLHDGSKLVGKVVERAAGDLDLALVKVPVKNAPYLSTAAQGSLKVGSFAATVGHNQGGIWTYNTGMVSNIYPAGHDRPVFQTQIPLNPGSSGGPIIDRRGHVLGIVTAGITGSNSINFGIRIEYAIKKLKKLSGLCEYLTIVAPKGVAVFVDGVMVGTGPRIVVPAEPRVYEVYASIGGKLKKVKIRYPEVRSVTLK